MNERYGFQDECTKKYGMAVFEEIADFFTWLPVGHVLNGKVLVVHGGLFSDRRMTIKEFQKVKRRDEVRVGGSMYDLLWSDPMDEVGLAPSRRGGTYTFGPDVTERFLRKNRLELLVRSHESAEGGYALRHGGKCVTVFSAPGYVGGCGSKGAVCTIEFKQDGSLAGAPAFAQFEPRRMSARHSGSEKVRR
jgi:serine/threonine-protein phosphatase 5